MAQWTKEHFELIAEVVVEAHEDELLEDYDRDDLAEKFANRFEALNPRFDSDLFLRACGVPWGNPTP